MKPLGLNPKAEYLSSHFGRESIIFPFHKGLVFFTEVSPLCAK